MSGRYRCIELGKQTRSGQFAVQTLEKAGPDKSAALDRESLVSPKLGQTIQIITGCRQEEMRFGTGSLKVSI